MEHSVFTNPIFWYAISAMATAVVLFGRYIDKKMKDGTKND